jgi:hypothetical protein
MGEFFFFFLLFPNRGFLSAKNCSSALKNFLKYFAQILVKYSLNPAERQEAMRFWIGIAAEGQAGGGKAVRGSLA